MSAEPAVAHDTSLSEELLVRRDGAAGVLSLNRPKALHALTLGMVHTMARTLLQWRADTEVGAVIVDHAAGRGFCAGGDIAALRESVLSEAGVSAARFFHDEYQLDNLIFTYPKPVVAFMDGVTMGGGVGITQPAKFKVATENTRFAIPETGIGLFPDVGGGWYLSRLRGRIGQFLALTGARLDGSECLWAGLATHYLASGALAEAKARIAADPFHVPEILGELAVEPPAARLAANAEAIERLFASDTYEEIVAALEADGSDWAQKELAALATKSPQSSKVALRQLAQGHLATSYAEVLAMEYRIAKRIIMRGDFAEGVRAVIVDKDNAARWQPGTPEEVNDALLDSIFAPLPPEEEWKPLA
jgi:enoyl-CoA hydratase